MVDFWLVLGFMAQGLFSARFLIQWFASERAGRSIVPLTFWYLSLCGSTLLLLYAIHRRDPVFILGRRSLRLMPQDLLISNMAGGGYAAFSHLQRV